MLDRLRRALDRRQRMTNIRQLQQDQARQALAVLLNEEEALKRDRNQWQRAHADAHGALLTQLDGPVRSENVVFYVRQMDTLHRVVEGKEGEITALQPAIHERRAEVIRRYKARRAMEILTDHAQDRVTKEELRLDQAALDETVTQRYRGPNGRRGTE
jgi:flagellar biosynthesis chaperone FliJ